MAFHRKSSKKSSMFKLQAQKTTFLEFLDKIQCCPVLKIFPSLNEKTIQQSSKELYELCYTFKQNSAFTMGLNYNNKTLGFSISQNAIHYRQWLPNIQKAFIMGHFNNYNKNSHQLKEVHEQPNWYQIDIDFSFSQFNSNEEILLRIINKDGKQIVTAPPSCRIRKEQKTVNYLPRQVGKKQTKIKEVIALKIDINKLTSQYIDYNKKVFEKFNIIILENLFCEPLNLLEQYNLSEERQEQLTQLIQVLTKKFNLKVILDWHCKPRSSKYNEQNMLINQLFNYKTNQQNFDLNSNEKITYYLSYLTFYLNNFEISGFHFNDIQGLAKQNPTLVKCFRVINDRFGMNCINLSSTKQLLSGVQYPILQGGLGINYHGYSKPIHIISDQQRICANILEVKDYFNCLTVNIQQLTSQNYLYFLLVVILSQNGIFFQGALSNSSLITEKLVQICQIRQQSQFFQQNSKIVQLSNRIVFIKRGSILIVINFNQNERQFDYKFNGSVQLLLNTRPQCLVHSNNIIPQKSCLIYKVQQIDQK